LEKLIDKFFRNMKIFRTIIVSSDGSYFFSNSGETSLTNKLVIFQKQDDKKFSFNQKKGQNIIDSRQSSYYKKKYLKYNILEYSQVARRSFLVRAFKGSNPFIPSLILFRVQSSL
jgi:hypothetical protein